MAIPDPPNDGYVYAWKGTGWVRVSPWEADSAGLDLSGRRASNAAASNLGGDYVTRAELEGLLDVVTALKALKVDGTNQMLANLNVGNRKLINVLAGVAATDGVNKGQMDAADTAAIASANAYTDGIFTQGQRFPTGYWERTVAGTWSFTIGVDCPSWVTKLYIGMVGGGGGAGGSKPPGFYTKSVTDRVQSVGRAARAMPWDLPSWRFVSVPLTPVWIPGGFAGDGARLTKAVTVANGNALSVTVGGFGTGGHGGGTSGNDAKGHCGGGGGGGTTTVTHQGTEYRVGGGGGGGGSSAGTYPGYGGRGGIGGVGGADGEPNVAGADNELRRGEPGIGAAIGGGVSGGGGGASGTSSGASSSNLAPCYGSNGTMGTKTHTDDPLAFLFEDLLLDKGVGGEPNTDDTYAGAQGRSGTPGAVFIRW